MRKKRKKALTDLGKTIEERKDGLEKRNREEEKAIEKELQRKLKDDSKTKVKGEQKQLN